MNIRNEFRDNFYHMLDVPNRVFAKFKRLMNHENAFSKDENLSDSESNPYSTLVSDLLENDREIRDFRKKFRYREILEHVDWKLGKSYLKRMDDLFGHTGPGLLLRHSENDNFGNPRRYKVSSNLSISLTTTRYVCVLGELIGLFELNANSEIVEIGVGYGGQAAIIHRELGVHQYSMYDLPQVEGLVKSYLRGIESKLNPSFENLDYSKKGEWDLVISNYAFSELPRRLQEKYLEKVLKKSRHGYMIMNSGKTNFTGRSDGKLTVQDLKVEIPRLKIGTETPLSGPDNYVIYW